MSTIQSTGYALLCDYPYCDVGTTDLGGDFAFWGDAGDAAEEWECADGYTGALGDYCPSHSYWDEELEEQFPLAYTIENEFKRLTEDLRYRADSLARRANLRLARMVKVY